MLLRVFRAIDARRQVGLVLTGGYGQSTKRALDRALGVLDGHPFIVVLWTDRKAV